MLGSFSPRESSQNFTGENKKNQKFRRKYEERVIGSEEKEKGNVQNRNGGTGRDSSTLVEFHLSKVSCLSFICTYVNKLWKLSIANV